ncbi:hypothetical protein [Mycobacterium sp. 360MFTsu5.1]|uniref:hypothetical protein n=1 Tax=Mycobacterium sp. 360MFTsu5.1 TaxID=1172186 RepID=UPI00035E349E|nr:hypothetical protein [Mycobacterium sp. 360MFTsu5.1]
MPGNTITLFMWGFQRSFRHDVETDLERSLEAIGIPVKPTVFLIGLSAEGGSGHPLCIEPEDGPIVVADFEGLHERADTLYNEDPNSQMRFSDQRSHERKHQEFRDRAYGIAIGEVLQTKLGLSFFVGLPTLVDEHFVFTAVGLPQRILDDAPRLKSEMMMDGRYPVTQSLVQGVIDEVLDLSTRALHDPNAGSHLGSGNEPADIARAAGRAVTLSATVLAGNDMPTELFGGLNKVATTPYEQRVGTGSLLIAHRNSEHIQRSSTLSNPVPISETRALRKLLESSNRYGESLLADGEMVYGFGRLSSSYPTNSESVFQALVVGAGRWELLDGAGARLLSVEYGAPRIPAEPVRRDQFDEICARVLGECDVDALWSIATVARESAEHGAMLVVSGDAINETARLGGQALAIDPAVVVDDLIRQFTRIDGAILVDSSGACHAAGVILDGTATDEGDRARGARYNSAVRYLASAAPPTVILLISEDGMINLLPDLRKRISRSEIELLLDELRKAAAIEPVHPEKFYNAYRQIEARKFYLSQAQCDEINRMRNDHWERRAQNGGLRAYESPLKPDPKMNDGYFLD